MAANGTVQGEPPICVDGICDRGTCCEEIPCAYCASVNCVAEDMESNDFEGDCGHHECRLDQCCKATTTTTTVAAFQPPSSNCPIPKKAKACHYWGEPHFTHLFYQDSRALTQKGGRAEVAGHAKILEFHEVGVYQLAKRGEDLEVQAFFCKGPGIPGLVAASSSGCGLAIKMGDEIVQFVRDASTKSANSNSWSDLKHWNGNDNTLAQIFVNGVQMDYSKLTLAGSAVGSDHFIQKMTSTMDAANSKVATCVGDSGNTWMVEWSVPHFGATTEVFESSVTVWAEEPEASGICGNKLMQDEISKGFFKSQTSKDSWQIATSNLLFSRSQMKILCNTCGMSMNGGSCGQYVQQFNLEPDVKKDFCDKKNTGSYTFEQATEACSHEPDEVWKSACELEMCASGGSGDAMALVHLEEKIEEHLGKDVWPDVPNPATTTTTTIAMIPFGDRCGNGGGAPCERGTCGGYWFHPKTCGHWWRR